MRHKRKRTALAALASLSLIGLPTAAHAVAGAEQAGVAPIGAPAAAAPGVAPVGGPGVAPAAAAPGAGLAAAAPVGADNAARDEEDARAQNGQDGQDARSTDGDAPGAAAEGAQSPDGAQGPDDSQGPDGAQSADGAAEQAESAGAGAATPIPDIQKTGEGDDSALVGKTVTAVGVVTSAHPKGEDGLASTLDGFTIQTPGTGGLQGAERQSSDGLFAYVGKADAAMPTIGQCVRVTGKVSEYPATGPKTPAQTQSLTQLAVRSVEAIDGCDPVKPVPLTAVPAPAQMEALESMLVEPQGTWTITDNYQANQYGTLSLTPGSEPLRQATDAVAPGDEARAMEADNAARTIALDDGTSTNLQRGAATGVPYAYLANGSPARVGYHVGFTGPVVLDSRHSAFVLQPTRMVAAHPDRSPVSISGERPGVPQVEGDVRVATFNVLNYFSDLGQDEPGCQGYPDREGAFVTAKKCKVRGAWSRAAFENQQTKIVQAINAIGADVVALEEIENPVAAGAGQDRDGALKALVDALNAHAGEQVWAHVPSPAAVPADEDVIRVAFIYRRATIEPVGESKILDDPAFTGLARQPLAQEFAPVVSAPRTGKNFVVVANHFKSKGSVPQGMEEGNTDTGDGQGNSNAIRVAQARALAAFAEQFAGTPTLLVGDFNSYSKEDPLKALTDAGWVHESADSAASYVYGGRSGSLDHVFSNAAADPLVRGVASWALNAQESVAFEYSRANSNAHLAFEADNPYRSSDHNPEIIGLDVIDEGPGQDPAPDPSAPPQPGPGGPTPAPGAGPKHRGGLASTGAQSWVAIVAGALLAAGAALVTRARGRR